MRWRSNDDSSALINHPESLRRLTSAATVQTQYSRFVVKPEDLELKQ
jgi:hypothetical protein